MKRSIKYIHHPLRSRHGGHGGVLSQNLTHCFEEFGLQVCKYGARKADVK